MAKSTTLIHEDIIKRFETFIAKERLAHAYLFMGPHYVGKTQTALAVARLIVADGQKYQSEAYKKIDPLNHPDIHVMDSGLGEPIKIDQVRALLGQAALRPFMAERKVFIIRNIENVTLEGANALLKTLEEPTANTVLILTTSAPEKNLETIRSRCHGIYFCGDAFETVKERLVNDHSLKEEKARILAYLSEGNMGKAVKLHEDNILKTKNDVIDLFILSDAGDEYIKDIISDKSKTKQFLDILLTWVRDSILIKAGVNDRRLMHQDRLAELGSFSGKFGFEDLNALYKEIVSACNQLAENLNVKIPLLIIKERVNHG